MELTRHSRRRMRPYRITEEEVAQALADRISTSAGKTEGRVDVIGQTAEGRQLFMVLTDGEDVMVTVYRLDKEVR